MAFVYTARMAFDKYLLSTSYKKSNDNLLFYCLHKMSCDMQNVTDGNRNFQTLKKMQKHFIHFTL